MNFYMIFKDEKEKIETKRKGEYFFIKNIFSFD